MRITPACGLRFLLSFILVALSPGLSAYQAWGQSVAARTAGAPAVGGAAGASVLGSFQAPSPSASALPLAFSAGLGALPGISGMALPAGEVLGAAASPLGRTQAKSLAPAPGALPQAQEGPKDSPASAFEGLQQPLPEFGRMGVESAGASAQSDFQDRIGLSPEDYGAPVDALGALPVEPAGSAVRKGLTRRSVRGRMPDSGRGTPEDGGASPSPSEDGSDLDELGNPRRRQTPGPDDVTDEPDRGSGDGAGSRFLAGAGIVTGWGAYFAGLSGVLKVGAYLGLMLPFFIVHEMFHAKMADRLGYPKPRLDGRLSLRSLHTHMDLKATILYPIATLLAFGFGFPFARPVEMGEKLPHRDWVKDSMLVAVAAPAGNILMAGLFAAAYAGLAAWGAPIALLLLPAAGFVVYFNVMLGLFNLLMPVAPFDGHHIVRWLLVNVLGKTGFSDRWDAVQEGSPVLVPLLAFLVLGLPIYLLMEFATGGLLSLALFLFGAAAPALPALSMTHGVVTAATGLVLAVGSVAKPQPAAPVAKTQGMGDPGTELKPAVKYVVMLKDTPRALSRFLHMGAVDLATSRGLRQAADLREGMLVDLEAAGLERAFLETHAAEPVATYDLINAVTFELPAGSAAGFRQALESRGHKVWDNAKREIIPGLPGEPNHPEAPAPDGRGAVTMPETLKISTMDKVHEAVKGTFGPSPLPGAGFVKRLVLAVLLSAAAALPQPPAAVIDSGLWKSHPLAALVKDVKNMTKGPNVDDIGHGTWVHTMMLWFAPWARNTTHYKTFVNGGASLDDILRALTTAHKDGNILMSNSWGSDDGDTGSPDSQLVLKLAEAGVIGIYAAGNAGSRKNTIGSPAIMAYRDARTGARRILAVAATDRDKKVVYFSSRGPGSPATAGKDWPRRPDAAEQGYNTEAGWPGDLRSDPPDRVDGDRGPVKSISGTSMSTPKLAGTILMLAMVFGATTVGDTLDKVVTSVVETLEKTGESEDAVGDGFNAAWAAYQKAVEFGLKPVMPGFLARGALRALAFID